MQLASVSKLLTRSAVGHSNPHGNLDSEWDFIGSRAEIQAGSRSRLERPGSDAWPRVLRRNGVPRISVRDLWGGVVYHFNP